MDENNTKKLTLARLSVPIIYKNGISFSISNRFVVPHYQASQVFFIGSEKASVMQVCFKKIK
jgi:hypothetical protein